MGEGAGAAEETPQRSWHAGNATSGAASQPQISGWSSLRAHWAPSGRSSTEAGQGWRAVQRRHSPPIEGACSSASGRTVPPASAAPPANETPSRWPAPGRTDFAQEQAQQSGPDSGIPHPFHMRWQSLHSAVLRGVHPAVNAASNAAVNARPEAGERCCACCGGVRAAPAGRRYP